MQQEANPKFVKWAGGKGQLIEQFLPFFPSKITRYIEPFVGSGAIFFYIKQKFEPKECILSDVNEELINTYKVIQDSAESLIEELKKYKILHIAEPKEHYYRTRATQPNTLQDIQRAARFIYLNKTCFNGLYRVNSKGEFNVPMGKYTNPEIVQEERLRLASRLLKDVQITSNSFEDTIDIAQKGGFVYFDPPYYPLEGAKSFTTYTKNNFMEKEQEKLHNVFSILTQKGCLCMQSNSDTPYIRNLYKEFRIETVKAKRAINSDASKRNEINEIVILNY
jgi:DNA adenine methylase